jgi:hypothetical protein
MVLYIHMPGTGMVLWIVGEGNVALVVCIDDEGNFLELGLSCFHSTLHSSHAPRYAAVTRALSEPQHYLLIP